MANPPCWAEIVAKIYTHMSTRAREARVVRQRPEQTDTIHLKKREVPVVGELWMKRILSVVCCLWSGSAWGKDGGKKGNVMWPGVVWETNCRKGGNK